MLEIFDSHAHYDDRQFDADRQDVLAALPGEGVVGILNCGSDWKGNLATFELCRQHDFLYAAVGIHPGNAGEWNPQVRERLMEMLRHPKVVAVGEIGLDYYWDSNPPREVQQEVLREQLVLALERISRGDPRSRGPRGHDGPAPDFASRGLRGVLHLLGFAGDGARGRPAGILPGNFGCGDL